MKYKSIFLLFSHKLTQKQESELKSKGISRFVYLPDELQTLWSNVPADIDDVSIYISPVLGWLKNNARVGDWVLVQGDFGCCYTVVDFCFENDLIPVYATTRRIVEEAIEGDGVVKISKFIHERFRKYRRWRI